MLRLEAGKTVKYQIAVVGRDWESDIVLMVQRALNLVAFDIAVFEKLRCVAFEFVEVFEFLCAFLDVIFECVEEKKKLARVE
jgi:hypothetical protein